MSDPDASNRRKVPGYKDLWEYWEGCDRCDGTGKITTIGLCSECNGNADINCEECSGRGFWQTHDECPDCSGWGGKWVEDYDEGEL